MEEGGQAMRVVAAVAGLAVAVAAPFAAAGPGKKLLREFVEDNRIYEDERWQTYVRQVAERLLAQTRDAGKHYIVTVLDTADINAFVTGDRHVFVSRGLLAFLDSEDQLAAVLGHELAHEVARHARKRKASELAGKSLGLIAAVATGRGELLRDVANPVTALYGARYSREMELEADRLGTGYMVRAGYYPDAAFDVLERLADYEAFARKVGRKPGPYHRASSVFASHPRNDLRLHAAHRDAAGLWQPAAAEPIGDYWAMLEGLAYGDVAPTGIVREGTFYHGGLRVVLKFPAGWQVAAPQAEVVGTAPGGAAVGSIVVARHEPVRRKSPAEYVADVLHRDDVIGGEERDVNGAPAFVGEIDAAESNVQVQIIAVVHLRRNMFVFRGECGPDGDPDAFRAQFEETLAGLRPMTVADAKAANSRRVHVVVAEPGDSYEALAKTSSLRKLPADALRVLNGDYPYGEPTPGDFVKVVR